MSKLLSDEERRIVERAAACDHEWIAASGGIESCPKCETIRARRTTWGAERGLMENTLVLGHRLRQDAGADTRVEKTGCRDTGGTYCSQVTAGKDRLGRIGDPRTLTTWGRNGTRRC